MEKVIKKPKLKLIGMDGNAFGILGRAQVATVRAKWPDGKWDKVREEATSGDYNHLLRTIAEHFDVS